MIVTIPRPRHRPPCHCEEQTVRLKQQPPVEVGGAARTRSSSTTPPTSKWRFAGQSAEFQDGTVHRIEFPQTNYEPIVVSLARSKGRIYCVGASCSHYSAPLYHGVVDGYTITCPCWRVGGVDVLRKQVHCNLGEGGQKAVVDFDKLLLATGGTPRTLPNALPLRTAADASAIAESTNAHERVLIAGGGFIGVECAGALNMSILERKGCSVTIVSPESKPFERLLGSWIAAQILRLLQSKGIQFLPNARVEKIEGSAECSGGRSTSGFLSAPREQEGSVLQTTKDGGILVDPYLRTSCDDVYAGGDVAAVMIDDPQCSMRSERADSSTPHSLRIEHWGVAQTHGRVAARSMLSLTPLEKKVVPFFWTVVCGKTLKYVYCLGGGRGEKRSSATTWEGVRNEMLPGGGTGGVLWGETTEDPSSSSRVILIEKKPHPNASTGASEEMSPCFVAYFCRDGGVEAVASMGTQEPIVMACAELLKRGEMLGEEDVRQRVCPIQKLRKLNAAKSSSEDPP
eukprot:g18475.t1